jgi:hypothetical protein
VAATALTLYAKKKKDTEVLLKKERQERKTCRRSCVAATALKLYATS